MTVIATETSTARTVVERRKFGGSRAQKVFAPTITIIVILALVQGASALNLLLPSLSPPTAVAGSLGAIFASATFWATLGQTVGAWAVAVIIAMASGTLLGVLIGSFPLLQDLTRPVTELLRPIPSVALIPLIVLTVGTGANSGIVLAVFASFWQVLVSAIDGAKRVDIVARDTARTYHFSTLDRFLWVQLPSALPGIITGLRLATSTVLILIVTAEIVIGIPGLGQQINLARSVGELDRMYAYIFLTGVLGVGLNLVVGAAARWLLRNHPPTATGGA